MPVQPSVNPHTIVLEGELKQRHLEYPAAAALSPGHILNVTSAGKVQKHGTADQTYAKLIAKEDVLFNGRTINDAYALDELVMVHQATAGDLVYARIPAAAVAIVKGDRLKTNGAGCLIKSTTAGDPLWGYAEEAVDNSAGGTEVFIRCRVA